MLVILRAATWRRVDKRESGRRRTDEGGNENKQNMLSAAIVKNTVATRQRSMDGPPTASLNHTMTWVHNSGDRNSNYPPKAYSLQSYLYTTRAIITHSLHVTGPGQEGPPWVALACFGCVSENWRVFADKRHGLVMLWCTHYY